MRATETSSLVRFGAGLVWSAAKPRRVGFLAAIVAACLAQSLSPAAAYARALDEKEKASLAVTLASFDADIREQHFDRVFATVPPRVMAAIAKKNNISVEKLKPAFVGMMTATMKAVKIESFSLDLANADYRELPSGAPFALIPTKTVIDAGVKGRISEKTFSLAIQDDGKWYILRVNDVAHLMILRDVYPEFAGVELPSGSMEILKK
jgi:hypothetical protein